MLTTGEIVSIFRDAVFTAVKVAAPFLLGAMLVGLVVSVFQAATQVHEQTITFVPKLLVIAVMLLLFAPWMITQMTDFTHRLFTIIALRV